MEIPRQQRIDGLDGLGRRQFTQHPAQPGVRLEAVGTSRLDERVNYCARMSARRGVCEQPSFSSNYNAPFILPISGRKLKSIIDGTRCMGTASRLEMLSSAAESG
jgi:hypothetical protein